MSGASPSVARYRFVSATQKINSVSRSNDVTGGAGCDGVDGLLGGVDGAAGGVAGLVGGFAGLAGGVDGLAGGVDGLAGGVDGLVGGVDGLVGVDGLSGSVEGLVGVAGLGGVAGPLGVSGLLGGVNGLLDEGPTGELQADIRAVVAIAIEITRRNRIGTRVIPHSGVLAVASAGPRPRHQPALPQSPQGQ